MSEIKEENRSARFKRVAERRTKAVLRSIRILGNCSNKSAYQYSDEEIAKIFKAIEDQIRLTKARFQKSKNIKFTL
ncbi:MAG: hypothetical protein WCX97_01585 [Candidatus Magasanikbacteria bacterium]|jgi:hypothetical protein